jgi:hypothetical protein
LGNFRHEAEKRLAEKDEEIEAIRWVNNKSIALVWLVQPMTFYKWTVNYKHWTLWLAS